MYEYMPLEAEVSTYLVLQEETNMCTPNLQEVIDKD
jgi:hypothetical protein